MVSEEEKAQARARLERRYTREYGKKVTVDGTPAQEGVLMGYALNIKKCIGCRRWILSEGYHQGLGKGWPSCIDPSMPDLKRCTRNTVQIDCLDYGITGQSISSLRLMPAVMPRHRAMNSCMPAV